MYGPVTINDILGFVQSIMTAFSDPLYLAFTLMITFTVVYHIKHLIVSGHS